MTMESDIYYIGEWAHLSMGGLMYSQDPSAFTASNCLIHDT